MAHIEDRWYKTIRHPGGRTERVKTTLFGRGMRYRVRYIGPDGREHKKSFPDRAKREAEAFLVSVEADKLRGAYVDPAAGRVKLRAYAEEWLRDRTFDESSREATEYKVRKHILPYLGDRPLASIRPGHIREWDRSLVGKLDASTRSVIFAHLRAILMAAVDDKLIAENPCSARSVKQPRPVERRVVPWKADEVLAIRAGLGERYRAALDVGAGCGARQGEIFGLGVDDLEFDGLWLDVRRQVKRVRSRLVFGLPKNDRPRRVPIPRWLARSLREHVHRYPPVDITLPWEDPFSEELMTVRLVFTTGRGGAINRSTFDATSWHPALVGAGIARSRATGMHALRHHYASVLLEAGVSIKALAEYLGHADPGFTLRVYTHLMPSSDARTRHILDQAFSGSADDDPPDALAAP